MTLFSDVDWAILLIAGGFLLLGKDSRGLLRTLGRYYGRAMRLKQELLAEFEKLSSGATQPEAAGFFTKVKDFFGNKANG